MLIEYAYGYEANRAPILPFFAFIFENNNT